MREFHGKKGTRIYRVWIDIKSRCLNSNNKQFKDYGGRGISICPSWTESFVTFYTDMGDIPFIGAQIDRRDNEKGYTKQNCRWATRSLNMANKKTYGTLLPRGVQRNGNTSRRFKATIQIEKVNYRIGVFETIEEASNAYNEIYKEWYGVWTN